MIYSRDLVIFELVVEAENRKSHRQREGVEWEIKDIYREGVEDTGHPQSCAHQQCSAFWKLPSCSSHLKMLARLFP
jgi:hypothetical protein